MVTVIALRSTTFVQNIVTSQNSQNSQNIVVMSQKSEKASRTSRQIIIQEKSSRTSKRVQIQESHHEHGQVIVQERLSRTSKRVKNSAKWPRRSCLVNKTQTKDRKQDMEEFLLMDQKLEQGAHERIHGELRDESKVETRWQCDRSERESIKNNRERFRTCCLPSLNFMRRLSPAGCLTQELTPMWCRSACGNSWEMEPWVKCKSEVSLGKSTFSSQRWLHETRDDAFRVERNS